MSSFRNRGRVGDALSQAAWRTQLAYKTAKHHAGQAAWKVHDYVRYDMRGRSHLKPPSRHPDNRYQPVTRLYFDKTSGAWKQNRVPNWEDTWAWGKADRNAARIKRKIKVKRFFGLLPKD